VRMLSRTTHKNTVKPQLITRFIEDGTAGVRMLLDTLVCHNLFHIYKREPQIVNTWLMHETFTPVKSIN